MMDMPAPKPWWLHLVTQTQDQVGPRMKCQASRVESVSVEALKVARQTKTPTYQLKMEPQIKDQRVWAYINKVKQTFIAWTIIT